MQISKVSFCKLQQGRPWYKEINTHSHKHTQKHSRTVKWTKMKPNCKESGMMLKAALKLMKMRKK